MSDLLSLLGLDSGANSNKTQSELLVDAYKATQQPQVDALKSRQTSLEKKQVFYNSLKTKVDSMVSQLDIFQADNIDEKFITRKATLSNSSYFTASASSDANIGVTTVKVNRLATNDSLVSKQMNLSGTDFSSMAGDKTISFTVNGQSYDITVNFTGSETNEEAMKKIITAINGTDDIDMSASLIKDTTSTGRISFTSKDTGADYNIQFADSDVLGALGITQAALNPGTTSRTTLTGTDAGYQNADYSQLSSEIVVGGITVTRNSNTVEDALQGVTFTLLKAHSGDEAAVTVSTDVNTQGVADLIKPILDKYNDLLKFAANDKTMIRSDSAVSSLRYRLRSIASDEVTTVQSGNPKRLTEIGIKINTDGTLSVDDQDKLESFLKDDPQAVADLFTSEDGFAAKLDETISNLTGDSGLIKSRTTNLTSQIEDTKNKTSELQDRIDQQAETMRKEYESMLKLMLEAQNQYTYLSGYSSGSYY